MDQTVQLLWNWSIGGRPKSEAQDWACALLEADEESDSILRLAGNPDLDYDELRRLIHQAVRDIGRAELLDLPQSDSMSIITSYQSGG